MGGGGAVENLLYRLARLHLLLSEVKKVRAIRGGEGGDMGAQQLDIGCAAVGVSHVNHGGTIVCQVEVHQAIDGKALAAPVYVVQDSLPGEREQANIIIIRSVRCICVLPNYGMILHNTDAALVC